MKTKLFFIKLFCIIILHSLTAQQEDCYVHIEDATGMFTAGYKDLLEGEACELRASFPAEFRDQFATHTFGYYLHASAFDEEHTGYSRIFENYRTGRVSVPYYLLIGKKSTPSGIHQNFVVHVELPATGVFQNLDETLRSAIQNGVHEAMKTTFQEKGGRPEHYVDAEIAGMRRLRQYLEEIVGGNFGFSEDILMLDGFELIAESGLDVRRNGPQNPAYPVFDFAGTEQKYGSGYQLIKEAASDGIHAFFNANGVTSSIILTDNANYQQGDQFREARETFEDASDQVVVWLHVYGSGTDAKLYAKIGSHFTTGEAVVFVNELYETFRGEEIPDDYAPIAYRDTSEVALRSSASCNGCFVSECPIDLKWRAIDCVVPCASGSSCTNSFGIAEFGIGVVSGALDGVLGDVLFLVSLGKSAGQAINEFASHTLFTPQWFAELLEAVAKSESWREGFLSKFSSDIEYQKEFWEGIYDGIIRIYDSLLSLDLAALKRLYSGIRDVIQRTYQNIIGNNGTVMQGYSMGSSVYFIVTAFLTGGAGGVRGGLRKITDLSATGMNKIKSLRSVDDFKSLIDEAIHWAERGAGRLTHGLMHLRCKLLVDGCFAAGTPVSLENGLKAIEEIELGEQVYVNSNLNKQPLFSGFDESGGRVDDPYVSREQRLVDLTSLNTEKWYRIKLEVEKADYSVSTVQLLRPHWWLKNNVLLEKDGRIWLSMPEMGVEGLATVLSLDSFQFRACPEKEIDQGVKNYKLSLVSGIFEHTSNDVWRLEFENGDQLNVTSAHPFYSMDVRDWRMVGELLEGEEVLSRSGVTKLCFKKHLKEPAKVYNLEVREWHNYLAGNSGFVVHNACLKDDIVQIMNGPLHHPDYMLRFDQDQYWVLSDLKNLNRITRAQREEFLDVIDGVGKLEYFWAYKALLKTGLRLDVDWLRRFSEWMDLGLDVASDVLPVRLLDNGTEIGRVKQNGFLPAKFNYQGTAVSEMKLNGQVHGKDLVRAPDGSYAFRYQYKTTKVYRTMTHAEWQATQNAGEFVSTGEAFVSTSREYCEHLMATDSRYDVLIEFDIAENTVHDLAVHGVKSSNNSPLVIEYGFENLPNDENGWANLGKVYFKQESRGDVGPVLTIGLKSQNGKDIFNGNLLSFQRVN